MESSFREFAANPIGGLSRTCKDDAAEIATDIPAVRVDEPAETLGRDLKLPKFLELQRRRTEDALFGLEAATP